MSRQREDESVEQFIMTLYQLAENCAYGELKEEMIRDQIVVGIRDTGLSQKLQLDATLTFEKAKIMVRQREAIQEQQVQMRSRFNTKGLVEHIKHKPLPPRGNVKHNPPPTTQFRPANYKPGHCFRCGKEPHPRQHCPARDATCHICQKIGPYSPQCFSRSINEVPR